MTKRAKVSAVVGVRINERELDILKRIQAGVVPCVLSVNGLARDFSCSVATVRNSIRALEDKDLITVRPLLEERRPARERVRAHGGGRQDS